MRKIFLVTFYSAAGFVILNLLLLAVFGLKHLFFDSGNPVTNRYGSALLAQIYPGSSDTEINSLLKETWKSRFEYDPYTQFKEGERSGKYVNVSEYGFRISKNQGPWPPVRGNYIVFLLGGSTTFNYGVRDEETISSFLQEKLQGETNKRISIYNFGSGDFYSSQERILLEKLILQGLRPNLVIFIDGLNDFTRIKDEPKFTNELKTLWKHQVFEKTAWGLLKKNTSDLIQFFSFLPLTRAIIFAKEKWDEQNWTTLHSDPESVTYAQSLASPAIERYLGNKSLIEAVAKEYSIATLFVLQPIPFYKYDLNLHPFAKRKVSPQENLGVLALKAAYEESAKKKIPNLFWLADIQEKSTRPLYVDQVHYSAEMSEIIAKKLVEEIISRPDFRKN